MFSVKVTDGIQKMTWTIMCASFCEARAKAIDKHKKAFNSEWAEVVAISHQYHKFGGR